MPVAQARIDSMLLRAQNAAASVAVVALACLAFAFLPQNKAALFKLHGPPAYAFPGLDFLLFASLGYSLAVAACFLGWRYAGVSKSLRCFRVLGRWIGAPRAALAHTLTPEDRLALLSTLLKGFFGPLMALSLMELSMTVWANGVAIVQAGLPTQGFRLFFDRHGFWFLLQVILLFDVLVFTVGYLVESRALGNQIRSVDPTLLGWLAALLCYPPFNALSGMLLGGQHTDFPQFDNANWHLALNLLLLALMAGYAGASLALGLKASNLTHRGVVAHGPYAVVRHPAYTCKNLAWWIGSMPLLSLAFEQSVLAGLQSLGSVIGWTLLYILRALTEEDHLSRVDEDYAAYAATVRFRFVPRLI